MEYRILGPFEVVREGVAIPLGGPRQQAVLITLLLHAGETLTADRIIEEVWGARRTSRCGQRVWLCVPPPPGAQPERPKGTPAQVLVSDRSGYRLDASPESIDASTFERLAGHGRRLLSAGDPDQAAMTPSCSWPNTIRRGSERPPLNAPPPASRPAVTFGHAGPKADSDGDVGPGIPAPAQARHPRSRSRRSRAAQARHPRSRSRRSRAARARHPRSRSRRSRAAQARHPRSRGQTLHR